MSTITILATGYGQRKLSNGMAKVARRILDANSEAIVQVYSWNEYESLADIAARIADLCHDSKLVMAAHSYGAWFETLLADELLPYGIPVDDMLFADGVQRPIRPPMPLVIPKNVLRLHSWYQTRGLVRGSDFKLTPKTKFVIHQRVTVHHPFVDEVKEFQDAVFRAATETAGLRVEKRSE